MSVTNIRSEWVSGNLVFYEDQVGQSVTGDVFTIGTAAVKIGGSSQDVDFQFYATGSKSFVIDAGDGTVTLAGITQVAAVTLATAINAIGLTTTDSGVLSSGTVRSLYIAHDVSGAKTGSAVDTGLGIVMSASAACTSMMGAHIHIHNTTNNFTGNMVGMMIDFDDPGNVATNVMLLDLYRDNTNAGSSRDCYIRMKSGGTVIGKHAILVEGTSNIMTEALFGFLGCGDTSFLKGICSGTIAYSLKVLVHNIAGDAGTAYYIPLYPTV